MTASGDQTIRMWDVNRDQCLAVFKGHSCSVKSVDFREDEICEYHGLMSEFFLCWWLTNSLFKKIFIQELEIFN